jgi:peptidyl-tRNA hydrolase
VLNPFQESDFLLIEETINNCCEAVNFFLNHNINETMNKYNQKNKETE